MYSENPFSYVSKEKQETLKTVLFPARICLSLCQLSDVNVRESITELHFSVTKSSK